MKQSDLVEALKKGIIGWIDFPKNCRIGYAQLENGRLYLPEDSYDYFYCRYRKSGKSTIVCE